MAYDLQILGRFRLLAESGEIELASRKAQALIAMLGLAGRAGVTRDRLIGVLWGDRGEEQARSSLRQALSAIRKAIKSAGAAPGLIAVGDDAVVLDPSLFNSDIAQLRSLQEAQDVESLARAVELLSAELLEGFSVREDAIETWLAGERRQLLTLKSELLRRLAEAYRDAGDSESATATARRLADLEPLNEDTHRLLMRFLAARGDRVAALQQFKACSDALKAELGIEPDAATRRLYEEIRSTDGELPAVATAVPKPAAKLAVAVLPFIAPAGEARDTRMAEAVARELIAELGRFSPLEVVGGVASFGLKDRTAGLGEVMHKLGARFAIEGAVEFNGPKLRVMAQLSDVETSRQIWAHRYDLPADESFELRDEIVAAIAGNLYHPLMDHALREALYHPPQNEGAATLYAQLFHRSNYPSKQGQAKTRELCFRLIAADPGHALVYESLAWSYIHDAINAWTDDPENAFRLAREAAARGIALDRNDPYVRMAMGHVELLQGRRHHAVEHFRTALATNPYDGVIATLVAGGLIWAGNLEEAAEHLEIGKRQSPDYNYVAFGEGLAAFANGRSLDAAHAFERFLTTNPDYDLIEVYLAVCQVECGDIAGARNTIERLRGRNRAMTQSYVARVLGELDDDVVRRMLAALKQAGLPDGVPPEYPSGTTGETARL